MSLADKELQAISQPFYEAVAWVMQADASAYEERKLHISNPDFRALT